MNFGVHENISPAQLKLKYPSGTPLMTREFVSGIQGPSADLRVKVKAVCQPSWDAGLTPMVSFKTDPVATGNGKNDNQIRALGEYLLGKPRTLVIWYHEPEDNMSGATFKKAFNRVQGLMNAIPVGYSAMGYQWRPSSTTTRDPRAWQVEADFLCADVYSGRSFPETAILPEHSGFKRWHQEIVVPQPETFWGLSERGWDRGSDSVRAAQIARECEWLKGSSAAFWIYWNTPGTEGADTLVNGPLATTALKKVIAPPKLKICPTCGGSGTVPV